MSLYNNEIVLQECVTTFLGLIKWRSIVLTLTLTDPARHIMALCPKWLWLSLDSCEAVSNITIQREYKVK